MVRTLNKIVYFLCLSGVLLGFPALVRAESACDTALTIAVPKATIRVGKSRALKTFADGVACAGLVASQREAIKQIDLLLDAGKYRQTTMVYYPDSMVNWDGQFNIVGSGTVVLTGASLVTQIQKLGPNLYTAPITNALYLDMKQHWRRKFNDVLAIAPPSLIAANKPMQIAREPDSGFMSIAQVDDEAGLTFRHAEEAIAGYSGQAGVFAHGLFATDWADFVVPVTSYNADSKEFTLEYAPKYGLKVDGRFYLEGAKEFANSDGEYAVSDRAGYVNFYLDELPSYVEITRAPGILMGEGISNLLISNITFEGVRGTALRLDGNNIKLDTITIRNTGLNAININGNRNSINNSKIYNIGASGVEISGGDRKSLTASGSVISNSEIYNFGINVPTGIQGVKMTGDGVQILKNSIHDSPYAGIWFLGNDHLIKGNEIYNVQKITGDSGAIYLGRDWTSLGNVIQGNYIHHVYGARNHKASAIYLDDQASGTTITDNIIANVHRGFLIGGGRWNRVEHNVVVNTETCMVFDDRGLNWQAATVQPGGVMVGGLKYMPYQSALWASRYPGVELLPDDRPGVPVGNIVRNNVGTCAWNIAESVVTQGGSVVGNNLAEGGRWLANPSAAQDSSDGIDRAAYSVNWAEVFPE